MTYERRFQVFLAAIVAFGFMAAGVTLVAAREVASDDMRVGPGSSKFPPQGTWTEPSPTRAGNQEGVR
jgi:hypothetical protein